ncbi:MAG TPA: hypothetical protein VGL45_08105, partial [Bradyrhizobium sp.]
DQKLAEQGIRRDAEDFEHGCFFCARFPGAAQPVFVVRCRPGIVTTSEIATVPDLRCVIS